MNDPTADGPGRPLMDAVKSFFTSDEWPFDEVSEHRVQTSFGGESGQWAVTAEVRSEYERFICYSIITDGVPDDLLAQVAEFITRVNAGLSFGNFELDYESGELRFRTSIDVSGETLTPGLVRQVVYGNVLVVDLFLAGLRAVLEDGVDPRTAIGF